MVSFATCFIPDCQLKLELTALCRHVLVAIVVEVGVTISHFPVMDVAVSHAN